MPTKLSDAEVDTRLDSAPKWRYDGVALVQTFVRKDFNDAITFVNAVAAAANAADHHPDISISWNRVTIRTWSHDAGGTTDRDFQLATVLDALP
jgi:4a-hydroxytetrahydrobiopterin dehydratase